jgi:hypothetical protein
MKLYAVVRGVPCKYFEFTSALTRARFIAMQEPGVASELDKLPPNATLVSRVSITIAKPRPLKSSVIVITDFNFFASHTLRDFSRYLRDLRSKYPNASLKINPDGQGTLTCE